jgi:hypothetical protein
LVPRDLHQHLRLAGLPSTSPAYAAMPFSAKLNAWRAGLESVRGGQIQVRARCLRFRPF